MSIFDKTYSTKASAERAAKRAGLPASQVYFSQDRNGRWVIENHGQNLYCEEEYGSNVEYDDYSGVSWQ